MAERWHDKTVSEVEELTGSDLQNGLTGDIARERLEKNGRNEIFPIEHRTPIGYMSDFSSCGLGILLILVALISLFFKEYLLAASSVLLILLSYGVMFMTYYSARVVLERAARNSLPNARVIRSGKLCTVKQDEIVAGDLIQLSAGDIVPCDARIVKDSNLYIVETGITDGVGSIKKISDFVEYRNVPPHMCHNMAWASTIVTKGSGLAIACEVGKKTLVRRTGKNKPAAEYHKLAIFDTLRRVGGRLSLFYIAAAFVISLIGLLPMAGAQSSLMTLLVALSLGTAALTEFLMLFGYVIVACGLFDSLSRKKKNRKGSLIKNADRIDVMKKVDTLIVPPESIYSKRQMSLEKAYVSGQLYDISERGFADNCLRLLKYAVVTTGLYGQNKIGATTEDGGDFYTFEEDAILRSAFESGVYNSSLESEYPLIEFKRKSDYNRFDTALVRFNGDNTVLLRGEADEILALCTHYYENGRIFRLGPVEKSKIDVAAKQLMRQAYRVIAIASKNSRYNTLTKLHESQNELIFEGFIALIEPILPGVSQTILKCRSAGIKVMLFSEEVSEKNYQIARAIGMVSSRADVISGERLRAAADGKENSLKLSDYTMFEGMSVSDKELAIRKLREDGATVAFLGNKLKEIALLREADIGMTECLKLTGGDEEKAEYDGCEALRFVSDAVVTMVDMDSSGGLTSAVEALESAKNINNNIDRMLRYLVSAQTIRLIAVLWFVLSGNMLLSPVAILVCGLIFDFSAILIMAFKKPSPRVLAEGDRDISEKGMRATVWKYAEKGAFCGILILVLTYFCTLIRLIPTSSIASSAFISVVAVSAALMMQTLSEGRTSRSPLKVSKMQIIYLAAVVIFIIICMIFKNFTMLITLAGGVSWYILIPAVILALVSPILSGLLIKLTDKLRRSGAHKKLFKKLKNKMFKKADNSAENKNSQENL